MADLKTKENEASVEGFLNGVADKQQREDAKTLLDLMQKATRMKPKMWGSSIVGFGSYHYKYASGHEGDTCLIGFSPRKANLTLYLPGGQEHYGALLEKLGKHKTGKGCLYIKRLDDVDLPTLRALLKEAARFGKEKNG
jgi:hypothetical protein